MADVWPKLSEDQRTNAFEIIRRLNDTYGPKIPIAIALLTPVPSFLSMTHRSLNLLEVDVKTGDLHYPYAVEGEKLNKRVLGIIKQDLRRQKAEARSRKARGRINASRF